MPEAPNNSEEANLAEQAQELAPTPPELADADAPETPQEQPPMIDVHPPHHAVTTWREFFVHMTTIVLGLLIAIGLEQSVEALHHLHQRHELEHDLLAETQVSLEKIGENSQYVDKRIAEQTALRNYVEALRANPRKTGRSSEKPPAITSSSFWLVDTPAWKTAQESSTVALLPREEAEMYDALTFQYDNAAAGYRQYRNTIDAVEQFEARFASPTAPNAPPVLAMSPDDLKQYSGLISDSIYQLKRLRRLVDQEDRDAEAIENGAHTREEIIQYRPSHETAPNYTMPTY